MKHMTLQQLHYILTIAETGSMNKAAELLYVSQPNLTSAVKELEREFGFAVFHRSGRGVTPTRDGAELLSYARQVWTQMEALNDRFFAAGGRRKHHCNPAILIRHIFNNKQIRTIAA